MDLGSQNPVCPRFRSRKKRTQRGQLHAIKGRKYFQGRKRKGFMISTQQSIQGQWGMRKVLIEINCDSPLPLVKVGVKGKGRWRE